MKIDSELTLLFSQKRFSEFLKKSEKLNNNSQKNVVLLNLISISYAQTGHLDKAELTIKKAYNLDKKNIETLYNYGKISYELGLYERAKSLYQELLILDQKNIQALNNLASSFLKLGNYADAEIIYKKCLAIAEDYKLALLGLASLYRLTNSKSKELSIAKKAYSFYRKDREINLLLCTCFMMTNQTIEAEKLINNNLIHSSDDLEFILLKAKLFLSLGKLDEMNVELKKALSHCSNNPITNSMMGICLTMMLDFENAKKFIYKGIDKSMDHVTLENAIYFNSVMNNQKEMHRLLNLYDKTYPTNSRTDEIKARILLKEANFDEGWKLYRNRKHKSELVSYIVYISKINEWNMNNEPENLLVVPEQGIGDEIMFLKLIELLDAKLNFTLCVDERLEKIVTRSFKDIRVITSRTLKNNLSLIEGYSDYIIIGDLCKKYIKNMSSLKYTKTSFLNSNTSYNQDMKKSLVDAKKINVGISWYTNNKDRFTANMSESDIRSLSHIERYNLINLQYGSHDNITNKHNIKTLNDVDYKNDLDKLFSIISICDFVITIDNCVAHFAGSIGKKTHLLLPNDSDWRWFEDINHSIWYNSVEVHRLSKNLRYKDILKKIIMMN